jgi:hypothetical protein
MVMPNKVVKPIDSLVAVGGFIKKILHSENPINVNSLFYKLNNRYPVNVTIEKYILTLDFLFAIGVISFEDEVIVLR